MSRQHPVLLVLGAPAAVFAGIAVGALTTTDYGALYALLLAVALVGVLATARFGVVVPLAALTILAFDIQPGPSLTGFSANNLAMLGLIPVLAYVNERNRWSAFRGRGLRLLAWLGVALGAWFCISVGRALVRGIPPLEAVLFGRDVIAYAALLPLAAGAFADPRLRSDFVGVMAVVVVFTALAESAAALGVVPVGSLVHASEWYDDGSLIRLYTLGASLVVAAFGFGLGAWLLGPSQRVRRVGIVVAVACGLDIALALGRMKYAGVLAGVLVAVLVWSGVRGLGLRALKRGTVAVLAVLAIVFLTPGSVVSRGADAVAVRFGTIFASSAERFAYEGNDTSEYRSWVAERFREALGTSHWAFGYGLLPPAYFAFTADPIGGVESDREHSLRNTDIGYLGTVPAIGLLGVGLIYGMTLLCAWLIGRERTQPDIQTDWLLFGALVYAVYAVGTSTQLVALFSAQGVTASALALGVALGARESRRERRQRSTA